jgi:glycosyltransferase involved in cell wall biosynthesis
MESALDLTIAIPVRNEEKNLPGCLSAIGNDLAKKIVIIDSNSTDGTRAVAKEWGVDVIDFVWNGRFPKKRNWFLRNYTPQTKWILFLDADEYITEEFKKELRRKLSSEHHIGYWLSYTTYFLGKQLKGGYPLRKLALFQVGSGEYEQIDEEQWSQLDMEVHEHPIIDGSVGYINSKIDHQDFRGISSFVYKHHEYACWEARRFLETTNDNMNISSWTWKQRLKYQLMKSVFFPPLFFCGSYFLYGGFKDGVRGFVHAALRMSYYLQTYCKIQELIMARKDAENTGLKSIVHNQASIEELPATRA